MEITWYGQSCFRLVERAAIAIVTDPYAPRPGGEPLRLKADLVTVSSDDPAHNHVAAVSGTQRGDVRVIASPGEYEIGGVFITGIAMRPEKRSNLKPCTVFSFSFDGLNVVHLGSLAFVPAQAQIDALETVDVLLVPIGGEGVLSPAQAAEVISMIEPGIVVPMDFGTKKDTLSRFLKEMGVASPKMQDMLKVSHSQDAEDTQVIVLEAKH
ncbi:MAG: MBL fold metallo-hydrolase [Thermoflexales bacterium]